MWKKYTTKVHSLIRNSLEKLPKKKVQLDVGKAKSICAQSSLSIFTQKYLRESEDNNLILQNKYRCIYDDNLGAKVVKDDCALSWIFFGSDF